MFFCDHAVRNISYVVYPPIVIEFRFLNLMARPFAFQLFFCVFNEYIAEGGVPE